ncbi:MAG: molybdopterin molybdotransferase MoeA [Bacteroidota bacterium]
MISFEAAYQLVLDHSNDYGTEHVSLSESTGRVLAAPILADRDFPPFDRATKDGIALSYSAVLEGITHFKIQGIIAAGTAKTSLDDRYGCMEIMTGAIVPQGADTVVMYEDIIIENGVAMLQKPPKQAQNIHEKGSDETKAGVVLQADIKISAAEIGVLASVGKAQVPVKRLPKITVVSSGNELVNVNQQPLPHQIRRSNSYALQSLLFTENIKAALIHFQDDQQEIVTALSDLMSKTDVLLISGGVSKGKFDFLPEALANLGVKKVFHGVRQRPGKPFWFGKHETTNTVVFSFPGNPVSTFANYHIYFKPWLNRSSGMPIPKIDVHLNETISNGTDLTRFIRAKIHITDGFIKANIVHGNGSGDLTSLAKSDGFIQLAPKKTYTVGEQVPFIPTRTGY